MKIAFNPSTVAALTTPPNNKDITFDLRGQNIFARGVKFYGTDTNTWRDIKINNVSIGSNILDLRNGSNTTLTNTDGVVIINSTWRPVVDNLTSDSTTSSLSAKQGKVLKALLNSKLSVYELAYNTNVGTIKNNGIYYSTTDASSKTLINSPFNTGFAFINMTSYDGGDDLRRSRLAFNVFGEIKVSDDRDQANTAETWYNVLTSKNSGINGSTIKLNGTSITVYSSGTADGRYVKKSGDTMSGVLTIDTTNFGALTIKRNDDANGASIQFRGKSSVYGYIGLNNSTKDKQFLRWSSDTSRIYTILDTSSTYISNGKGVINGTTITQVDNATNSTNSTNARKLVNWYSARPTSLNAQFGDGSLRIFYATSSTTEGKPAEDSHILHLAWDNTDGLDAQLAVHTRSGKVSTRAQNGGTWQPWKTLAFTTDIPSSLKNPYALTISLNGTSQGPYDGSAAKNINITPGSIGAAVSNHSHDYLVVNSADDKSFNSAYHNFQVLYADGGNGITGKPANVDAFGLFKFRAASGWSGQMLLANGGSLYIRSSEDAKMTNTLSWKTILDSSNYSSILNSRYYTESEVNSLLNTKLNRQNLSYSNWNPRGWNLAADYYYNGGNISIAENNGKMYISVDGCFWQNEGQYKVLDTSDISNIQGSLTLSQYLSATDDGWFPLVWGGSTHLNTSDSTGPVYKSYDKLSWQTSSQTLQATNIQTNNIKNLSVGGGIYWNPYAESNTDNTDVASITLDRQGVAGGTTLIISQMNDAIDTIQFKTHTDSRLYHNSYPILTTQNTYISNGKGVINGTTITQVDNATNSTNSTNARKLVNWYSARPTSLNAQFGDGSLRIFYATSSTTEGKPAEDSHILHLAWDNTDGLDAQLAVHTRSGKVSTRAQNGGTWQPWKTLAFTTDIPSSLKNPYALTISLNGTSQGPYDGSAAKNINITPGSIGAAVSNHSHDYLVVNSADDKSFNSAYHNFQVLYADGGNGITGKPANVDAFGLFKFRAASGWSGQMLLANGGSLYIRSSEDAKMTNTLSWKTILDSSNYSSILNSRYYTESEVNSLLNTKLNRQNLSYSNWNPRGWNLAADYYYNGGNISIAENNGKMYISVDGCFWQNEGQYKVLDTSDISNIQGSLTLSQYLSATDDGWFPLVWGGSTHLNTSDSTGPVYKSYDKLSWQTSSQTLQATNIQTNNIKNLSVGGGIYWNPYAESNTDNTDVASITLDRQGVAGGTTLIISQMNDAIDTIQFKTHTDSRLYHNSYPILTTQNTYVSNNKGYINGLEITQVNNADTTDGYHATDGRTFNGNINWGSWNNTWSDGTHTHPWYGFDHRYPNTGAYSTTISDYAGMTIKSNNTLLLDCGTLLLNSRNNVGIGTSVPSYKLDVNGQMRASGFHHSSVNSNDYMLLAGGGYKSFGGDYSTPIFLGCLNLYHGNDGTISSSFYCLGYSVSFTYTRGGNYCKIIIPDTAHLSFYTTAAIASVNYSGGGMDTWVGDHRGQGAWWLHCYVEGRNEVRVKGFHPANSHNDSWWGGNPLYSDNGGANKITVCIFGHVTYK